MADDFLPNHLPWREPAAPGVIRQYDGTLQASFRLTAPDLTAQSREVQGSAAMRANNAVRRLGQGWSLFMESRRVPYRDYPETVGGPPIARLVDAENRERFLARGKHFVSEYTVTLAYKPPSDQASWLELFFVEGQPPVGSASVSEAMRFRLQAHHLAQLLGGEEMLRPLDDHETCTYLHACCSWKSNAVRRPDIPEALNWQLSESNVRLGHDLQIGPMHVKIVSIATFPDAATAGFLRRIDDLGFEYRWVTRYIALPRPKSRSLLRHIQAQHWAMRVGIMSRALSQLLGQSEGLPNSDAINKTQSVDLALQEIGAEVVGYGHLTDTIVVWDLDYSKAEEKAQTVAAILDDLECVSAVEGWAAADAWKGTWPGNTTDNLRKPLGSSLNRVHLMPGLIGVWSGPERNERLGTKPLLYATTRGSTPFRIDTHYKQKPNFMVVGPIRSGKTALLGKMSLLWTARHKNARVVMMQVKGGGKCETLCMGGRWVDLGAVGKYFQPLRDIHIAEELEYRHEWVCDRLREDNLTLDAWDKGFVRTSLEALARAPLSKRTMTELSSVMRQRSAEVGRTARPKVGDEGISSGMREETRLALKRHFELATVVQGYAGGVLDAESDAPLDAPVQCFEWERLLEDKPSQVPATLTHLWHNLDRSFTGDPVLFLADELERLTKHPHIVERIDRVVRTYAFRNVVMGLCTQAAEDLQKLPIWSFLLQSCDVRICLPNPSALSAACSPAYAELGLTDTQIHWLAQATPQREYLVWTPEGCGLADIRLEGAELAVCGRSWPEHLMRMDEILAKVGLNGFSEVWLRDQGASDAAVRLADYADAAVVDTADLSTAEGV